MWMIPLLLSCVAPPALAEEPPATREMEKWSVPFESAMHVQFAHATDVVYYVILGDLEKAKAEGSALAALERPEMPEALVPAYERMKKAAAEVATSPDLDTAAERAVALGGTCAACHSAHQGPSIGVEELHGEGWSGTSAMDKHQWAAYLMWLGTILPSDAIFSEGSKQLAHDEALQVLPKRTEGLEARVHALAAIAGSASDADTRARATVAFLQTCAACHAKAEVEFKR